MLINLKIPLPQFSPFSSFGYHNNNFTIAWNNGTTNNININGAAGTTPDFLWGNLTTIPYASYWLNGTFESNNPTTSIAFGQTGDTDGSGIFRLINNAVFAHVDGNSNYQILSFAQYNGLIDYYVLFNPYNGTTVSHVNVGGTFYNGSYKPFPASLVAQQYEIFGGVSNEYTQFSIPTITEKTYPVYFNNSLWSSGQSWSVSINGFNYQSTTNQIEVNLTTGSYNYTSLIANTVFSASSNVNVTGNTSAYYVNVPFNKAEAFKLTVNVNGFSGLFNFYLSGYKYTISSGQSIYPITNGSYSYTADFGPSYKQDSGTVIISGNTTLTLTATIQTYHYKFTSNYAGFHINIAGYGNTSESGTVLYLNISNYNTTFTAYYQPFFSVSYSPSQNIGDTLYQNFTVTFTAIAHYTYYIYETGLVLGSPFSTTNTWSINYNGTVYSSSVNYIEITTTSTSITFLVYGVDGYSVNHRIITVAETGNNTIYSDLNFTQDANTTPYSIGLLWSYFPYIFTTILVAAIFIPIGLVVRRARRKDR